MVEIPNSVTVNTGNQEEVHRDINKFFVDIVGEIEKKIEKGPSRFRLEVVSLCGLNGGTTPRPSDNMCHVLYYKERVVAAVFETRTDLNYIHFDYFLNTKLL